MNRRHHTSTKAIRVSKPSHARHASQLLAIAFGLLATLVLGVASASAAAPTVSIEPASEVGYTTAHVTGTVDPEGSSSVRGALQIKRASSALDQLHSLQPEILQLVSRVRGRS